MRQFVFYGISVFFLLYNQQLISQIINKQANEKIYVSTNKPLYNLNETINFSAFIVSESKSSFIVTPISKILYIELLDGTNAKVFTKKYAIMDGNAFGQIPTKDFPGGEYTLIAYTAWNLNFYTKKEIFSKKIYIQENHTNYFLSSITTKNNFYKNKDTVNFSFELKDNTNMFLNASNLLFYIEANGKKLNTQNKIIALSTGNYQLQCILPDSIEEQIGSIICEGKYNNENFNKSYPIVFNSEVNDLKFLAEGGHAVSNIPCKYGIKCNSVFGQGLNIKGIIVTATGEKICDFATIYKGMGNIVFTQEKNKKYFAKITKPYCDKLFPIESTSENSGVAASISFDNKIPVITIQKTDSTKTLKLCVTQDNAVIDISTINLQSETTSLPINVKNMRFGIAKLQLLQNNKIIFERLFFVHNNKKLHVELIKNKTKKLNPAANNKIEFIVKDENNKPVKTSMAISVINESVIKNANDKQASLLAHLILCSELKGTIEDPNYYFENNDDEHFLHLDNLLLTHGWRKISYENINYTSLPYKPENAALFSDYQLKPWGFVNHSLNNKIKFTNGYFTDALTLKPISSVYKIGDQILNTQLFITENKDSFLQLIPRNYFNNYYGDYYNEEYANYRYRAERGRITVSRMYDMAEEDKALPTPDANYNLQYKIAITPERKNTDFNGLEVLPNKAKAINFQPLAISQKITTTSYLAGNNDISSVAIRSNYGAYSSGFNSSSIYTFDNFYNLLPYTTLQWNMYTPPRVYFYSKVYDYVLRKNNLSTNPQLNQVYTYYTANPIVDYVNINDRKEIQSLYFHPNYTTDTSGKITLELNLNNNQATYRFMFEGIGLNGELLCDSVSLSNIPKINIEYTIPTKMYSGDQFYHQIKITNNSADDQKIKITLTKYNYSNRYQQAYKKLFENIEINLSPNQVYHSNTLDSASENKNSFWENYYLTVSGNSPAENIQKTLWIESKYSYANLISPMTNGQELLIKNPFEADSVKITISNPNPNEIFKNTREMLRRPSGCFEQVSSSNYPNILAYTLLKKMNIQFNEEQIKEYISSGISQLKKYKTAQGGYEWYGATPPHQALTAYGLMQFYKAYQLGIEADKKLVDETYQWLENESAADGSFNNNSGRYDHFAHVPSNINNAYITYTFSIVNKDVKQKYIQKVEHELENHFDIYRAALLFNIYINTNNLDKANELYKKIIKLTNNLESDEIKPLTTVCNSSGAAAKIETLSFIGLGIIKVENKDLPILKKIQNELVQLRKIAGFYQTQSMALSTEFFANYLPLIPVDSSKKTYTAKIFYGNQGYKEIPINKESETTTIYLENDAFTNHNTTIKLVLDSQLNNYFTQLNVHAKTQVPYAPIDGEYSLKTTFTHDSIEIGKNNSMNISITNNRNLLRAQTVASIYFPVGMIPSAEQLAAFKKQRIFDHYEWIDNKLVLYFLKMKPLETKNISLTFSCDYAGNFSLRPAFIYAYYEDENVSIASPAAIKILPTKNPEQQ